MTKRDRQIDGLANSIFLLAASIGLASWTHSYGAGTFFFAGTIAFYHIFFKRV